MSNVFIGLIFLFFDLYITFSFSVIGLLPDFVGCIFIAKGCHTLSSYSPKFSQCENFAKAAAIYSGVCYVLDLLGISRSLNMISLVLSVIMAVIGITMLYFLVYGISETERSRGVDLCGEILKNLWIAYTAASACGFLTVAMGMDIITSFLSLATTILTFVILYFFYRSKTLFYFTFHVQ